jgi:HEAT repeat protein
MSKGIYTRDRACALGFAAPSDPFLRMVLAGAAAVGVLSLALILYTLTLRLVHRGQQRRWRRCIASWQPLIAQCMETVPIAVPALRRADETALLTLWNHTQESVRGDATARLNILARQCGLRRVARRLLRKRGLHGRLLGVVTLGHLRDTTSWDELRILASDPRPVLSLCAARALMLIHASRALPELLPFVLTRTEWPLARLASILAEAGPAQVSATLLTAMSEEQGTRLARLVRLLDFAHGGLTIPHIGRLLVSSKDEAVLLACLKSLHLPHDPAPVRALLLHASWTVRTQAARALGRIGTRDDMPSLLGPLADPVWWVRYRAAEALVSMPGIDREEIARIRLQLTDRYAIDMLDQAQAETQAR